MKKSLFSESFPFIETLAKQHPNAGFYIVGGAVRDALLNRPYKDYDFVFTGIPIDALISSLQSLGEVNLVGKRFGVLKFRSKERHVTYDIALPRKEFSLSFSGGYRDFEVQSDYNMPIEQDLARRDLTINAMAYNIVTHELVDPFLGERDLAQQIIRTVGSPTLRFQEDYSRMLRAIRFACKLDFHIHEHTKEALVKLAHHIQDTIDTDWIVAREVISQEFLKAFEANPTKCLYMYDDFALLKLLLPEIKALQETKQSPPYHLEGSAWNHLILSLSKLDSKEFIHYFKEPVSLLTKLAILFHDIGKTKTATQDEQGIHFKHHEQVGAEMTQDICRRLALGASPFYPFSCKRLSWIIRNHMISIYHFRERVKRTHLEDLFFTEKPGLELLQCMLADQLASVTEKHIQSTEAFEQLFAELQEMAPEGSLPAPLISGKELIDFLAIQPGPKVKTLLNQLREEQLQGKILTKDQAKAYLKTSHIK